MNRDASAIAQVAVCSLLLVHEHCSTLARFVRMWGNRSGVTWNRLNVRDPSVPQIACTPCFRTMLWTGVLVFEVLETDCVLHHLSPVLGML